MGGKKRHSKDRLFITTTEHKYEWGGKKEEIKVPIAKLPFFCCSLSLLPFDNPVCSPDGIVFDIINIIPYIKKYKRNPVTGQQLKLTDLIKLNFHKNQNGEYHDPISFKIFTDFTHIVAIKTSGNVYGYDTVEELNRKSKNWHDLLTNEQFTIKDIITLQDPLNLEKRTVGNFDYIKNNLSITMEDKNQTGSQFINQNQTAKRIFEELEKTKTDPEAKENPIKKLKLDQNEKSDESMHIKEDKNDINSTNNFIYASLKEKKFKHEVLTNEKVASSFTSTNLDPKNMNEFRALTENEIRKIYYNKIKSHHKKGFVQIQTNFGNLDIRLDADLVPKTCENFIELCEKKYYNNTIFHRLIPNFCLQGGDPTSTGKGGESIFGKNFEDEFHPKLIHDKLGKISMANSGKNTNGSQFFITLGECKHLDNKHSVFGEIINGLPLLNKFNSWKTNDNDRPVPEIKITQTIVAENPFRDAINKIKEEQDKSNSSNNNKREEFYLQKEANGFILPQSKSKKVEENSGLAHFILDSNHLKEKSEEKAKQIKSLK